MYYVVSLMQKLSHTTVLVDPRSQELLKQTELEMVIRRIRQTWEHLSMYVSCCSIKMCKTNYGAGEQKKKNPHREC